MGDENHSKHVSRKAAKLAKSPLMRLGDPLLAESTVLSLLGGCIGVMLAFGLSKLATVFFELPTALPIFWTFLALATSANIGFLASILRGRRRSSTRSKRFERIDKDRARS